MPNPVGIILRSMVTCAVSLILLSATPSFSSELGEKLYLLGEQRDSGQINLLIQHLEHSDPHIRRIAAHALGKLGQKEAVPYLIQLVNYPNQPLIVRCVALRSLARLGGLQANRALLEMCGHENLFLRREANCALKRYASRTGGKDKAGARPK